MTHPPSEPKLVWLTRVDLNAAHSNVHRFRSQQMVALHGLDSRCVRLHGLLPTGANASAHEKKLDPVHGERMGDYHTTLVAQELRGLRFTLESLKGWKPATLPVRHGLRTRSAA